MTDENTVPIITDTGEKTEPAYSRSFTADQLAHSFKGVWEQLDSNAGEFKATYTGPAFEKPYHFLKHAGIKCRHIEDENDVQHLYVSCDPSKLWATAHHYQPPITSAADKKTGVLTRD